MATSHTADSPSSISTKGAHAGEHTPGPWHVYDMNPISVLADRYTVKSRLVADCTPTISSKITDDQAQANARLIAAAPDLLDEHVENVADLEYLVNAIDADEPLAPEMFDRIVACLARSCAAIAKATGATER